MSAKSFLIISLALFPLAATAQADLTIVNYGGAGGDAERKAFFEPYEKASGGKITQVEYNGEQAKIKAMVESKNVVWDVVEVESTDIIRGCDEGLFEKMDWSRVGNKSDFIPSAVHECGVGIVAFSTVIAYDADRFKDGPKNWADFWDVKKYPGKRGLKKTARATLEFALMADGVPPKDVYKVLSTRAGVDRAFKKLDELKPNIQFWSAGSQPAQYLASGDVVMTAAYNGRIAAAQKQGKNFKVVWTGGALDMDYWVIPKGDKNKDAALKFIAQASSAEEQANFARILPYGPTNVKAMSLLDAKLKGDLPNGAGNAKDALQSDARFWVDNGEVLEKRFAAWASQ